MEIHYADKDYRKRAMWLLGGIVLLCGVLLWQLQAWLDHLTAQLGSSDPEAVRFWVRLLLCSLGIGLAIPAIGLGLTLRQLGHASRLEGRFPPAKWRTLRDVRVLRDAPGLAWARRVEWAGTTALALAGLLIGWAAWAWWKFRGMNQPGDSRSPVQDYPISLTPSSSSAFCISRIATSLSFSWSRA